MSFDFNAVDSLEVDADPSFFQQYTDKFGEERGQGFLDALAVVSKQLDAMFQTPNRNGTYSPNSPFVVRAKLKRFLEEKEGFLNKIKEQVERSGNEPTISPT